MSFGIHIEGGGTHAGWRTIKPKPRAWKCCSLHLAGYLARCPDCGRRRHDDHTTSKRATVGD